MTGPHQLKGRKLLLKSPFALGDITLLTGVVRDIHRAYPGQFRTGVETSCPALWWYNPYIHGFKESDPDVEVIECECPLVAAANSLPAHALEGFTDFIAAKLDLPLAPREFRGDIHLSQEERTACSPVAQYGLPDLPYWLILGGGKIDLTIKWWDHERYQEIVDHFRNRILFVQLGRVGDHHPRLRGTLDLRGRTTIRDLVLWVYHAQGVVCGVTGLMHLAAAVPNRNKDDGLRPCVVIGGGREPAHWEAYPGHQFLHTIGALPCCKSGGCWRSRIVPLGDGSMHDGPDDICVDVVNNLPHCMDMITPEDVIRQIQNYLNGRNLPVLSPGDSAKVGECITKSEDGEFDQLQAAWKSGPDRAQAFLDSVVSYPETCFHGRGIVMCAGGVDYFSNAWVAIQLLREKGCRLPIELWHVGQEELDGQMRALIEPLQVRCVDATAQCAEDLIPKLKGFPIKPYAILNSSWQEVLFLDADNLVLRDPEFLFHDEGYRQTGALFWPDYGRLGAEEPIWQICGVGYRNEPEFESGQMVLDKSKCWKALNLAWHYNEQAHLYYRLVYGDKETFHMAFRKTGTPYAMPSRPVQSVDGVMIQHDPTGARLFEHLGVRKFLFHTTNPPIPGLQSHPSALQHLAELRRRWNGDLSSNKVFQSY